MTKQRKCIAKTNKEGEGVVQVIETKEILNTQVSVYGTSDNPLFLAKEVADWIEHSRASEMLKSVDEEEKLMQTILASGQNREMWFLTEDGLYEVLMQSRKPIAKKFKKEVKRILKDIRKHGMYATDELLDNPDLLIATAQRLKEEKEKRIEAERINAVNAPKVLFAEAVSASKTTILVGEMAKILNQNGVDIGQNRLFIWLRENGYLIKRKGSDYNMPTQSSMDRGLLEIKESVVVTPSGGTKTNKTPKVTGKGQQYFVNKFLGQVA